MKRLATVLGCVALLAAARAAAQEPSFQGRTLTAWLDDLENGLAPETRDGACMAIAAMGLPAAPRALPALIKALADPYTTVRYAAAYALKELGPAAAGAVPALERTAGDRNDDVAFMARKALRAIRDTTAGP